MSKAPPIPPEQRAFRGEKPAIAGGHRDRHDSKTGLQSGQPGDADTDLAHQGRAANLRQNTTHLRSIQDR